MWTPKRIVLLVMGFALFITGYFAYSFALGGIDGLPPLPSEFLEERTSETPQRDPGPRPIEEKLRLAFGRDCPEAKWPITLELSRSGMVLASVDARTDSSGRLMLQPFSVAVFGKPKNDGKGVEINTIRSEIGYVSFDRPINSFNPNEINGRKIVGAELSGNIRIINNRSTARRDDDLEVFIPTGPLYFDETKHLIWTYDDVHLTDWQSRPKPHKVDGKGMEMELLVETPPPGPTRKPRQDTITGVKSITLQSNVDMNLYLDSRSGFLGKPNDKPADLTKQPAPNDNNAADKALLHITTPGCFHYSLGKEVDKAHFETTPGNQPAGAAAKSGAVVHVTRIDEKTKKTDQLVTEVLDLTLSRKEANPPATGKEPKPVAAAPNEPEQKIEIASIHAFSETPMMTLVSDSENLDASDFVDLFHDAKAGLTVLRGGPRLSARKDDNRLLTRELHIQTKKIPGTDATYQEALAYGPGQIDLYDKQAKKYLQHAYWNEKLLSTKDERTLTAKGEMQDRLELTGKARFEVDEPHQSLQADTVKVWFSKDDKTVEKATPAQPLAVGQPGGAKIHHMEAIRNVTAQSPQMNIHDTAYLMVTFKDAPPDMLPTSKELEAKAQGGMLPADNTAPQMPTRPSLPGGGERPFQPGQAVARQTVPGSSFPPGSPAEAGAQPGLATTPPSGKEPEPQPPIELSARSVEAYVLRSETNNPAGNVTTKNSLDRLRCEGMVHVHQAPAKKGEQGVDITGDKLAMDCHPDGNELCVMSNDDNYAKLLMNKILIMGPVVNVNQPKNKVWVDGAGGMSIDSTTSLDGKQLVESEPLTITWQESMFVQGIFAEFTNSVVAEQKDGRMSCNKLQVFFDQPISLKEGPRNDQSPKVQKMLCEKDVDVQDKTMDGDRVIKRQQIVAKILSVDALLLEDIGPRTGKQNDPGNEMRGKGPGRVITWQVSGADPLAPAPNAGITPQTAGKPAAPQAGAKADDEQPKLTVVNYGQSMYANSKENFISFLQNVKVIHMPVDDPFIEVDENFIDVTMGNPPKDALYLSCNNLKVYTRQEKGKSYKEMQASDNAVVQGTNFWGRATVIHFDESKEQVIFDGGPDGLATLYKFKQKGDAGQPLSGHKIIYNRATGALRVDGGNWIEAN